MIQNLSLSLIASNVFSPKYFVRNFGIEIAIEYDVLIEGKRYESMRKNKELWKHAECRPRI